MVTDFEMDTEKQKQHRRDDARLTESGNARSEQLNTRGAYRVANKQSLACLSGSECPRPGLFLDMKYQTCFFLTQLFTLSFWGDFALDIVVTFHPCPFGFLKTIIVHCQLNMDFQWI